MKYFQILFVFTLMLLCNTNVFAQYGNNGYGNNGYGRGGFGSNNGRMGQMNQGQQEREAPKEIPIEVTVGKIMEKLRPELNLDQLQEIAIANVLAESIRSQGILLKAETPQEQKFKEIKALSEVTDRKINEFLNDDQKVKFKELNEEGNNSKKSRRKK